MKRMIAQSLITWVKSLFHRIAPGTGEGDIEIGGNLEVDGDITAGTATFDTWKSKDTLAGVQILTFRKNENIYELYGYYSLNLLANITCQQFKASSAEITTLNLPSHGTIRIGSTSLSEAQLQKLIALIPE